MANRTLPDSDYDIDVIAYGIIWRSTLEFHSSLRVKAANLAGNDPLDVHHVQKAIAEINEEISRRTKRSSLRELVLAFGSGLIGVFLAEVISSLNTGVIPSFTHFLVLALGIILVVLRPK